MDLNDWKNSNEYSHYQSLMKQDIENRRTIKRLIEELRELKRKQANGAEQSKSNCNIPHVVGRSEQLFCPSCESQVIVSDERHIDNVTTTNLDLALRMVGISFDLKTIDKIIDLVELIESKGDDTSMKDVIELQGEWSNDY